MSISERSALSTDRRSRDLAELDRRTASGARPFDVLVIGGGVTGAGVALDAAARGLSVVLVEAADLASGTSSRSGKTVHGGLRYLEQLNVRLVLTALRERELQLNVIAPYLTTTEPFLFPLTRHWERGYIGAGVALYDLLAGRATKVPHHRQLSRKAALAQAPGLNRDVITGGVQYSDLLIDDARHTMTVARTAAGLGAVVLSRTRATGLLREGARVVGARVVDTLSGAEHEVSARVVVNAAGVWAADIRKLAGTAPFAMKPAKGVHLVVPRSALESSTGILARAEDSVIVLRRWRNHWVIGTTDTPWNGERTVPVAEDADIEYLLRNSNKYLARPLTRRDVVATYAGLRPLLTAVGKDTGATSALSRDHAVMPGPDGLVTIVGGKYTTYRAMAADTVDAVLSHGGLSAPPSPTASLPLVGAARWPATQHSGARLATEFGLSAERVSALLGRYGDLTREVVEAAAGDRAQLDEVPGTGHLAVEFHYAVSHEAALTLDDLLARRTHVAIEQPDAGRSAAERVARLVSRALGWDEAEIGRQVRDYHQVRRAEGSTPADIPSGGSFDGGNRGSAA